MADGALGGLRVVELGGEIAAAYATKLLADLGADVLKLEPPGGDPLRAWGPFPADRVDVAHDPGNDPQKMEHLPQRHFPNLIYLSREAQPDVMYLQPTICAKH